MIACRQNPLVLLVAAAALSGCASPTGDAAADRATGDEIRRVLEDYVVGWRDGDVQRLSHAFAEDGRIFWRSGSGNEQTLASMTFAEALTRRRPQPDYGRPWSILRLDVLDDQLAVAKLEIARAGGHYVDYLVLQKIAGQWRIVVKTYVSR